MKRGNRARCTTMYIIVPIVIYLIGLSSGRYMAYRNLKVSYISQAEILELEQERMRNASDKQLFFGEPTKAIQIIDKIMKLQKQGEYILLSQGKIYGDNVRSVSKPVHQKIINILSNGEQ